MSEHDPNRTMPPDSATNATFVPPPDEQARMAAEAGIVAVPGFAIESTLGHGAHGVVYKAKQDGLNRVVALKMLLAGSFASPATRARFFLEAESVAALEHPGVVKVFAFGEHGGHPYLAMEFLPGGTLAQRIKTGGPLPAKDATELLAKLAAAVAHAHSRGVVHRDIKPLNVLLTAEGEPRLTDFGLAKVGRANQNLSVTGQVLGTPAYMAPEQAAGKIHEVGTAADVYALGAVLYDVLTGRPPFQGESAAVTLQKVLNEEPQRPRKLNASIPRDLETICLKCLEKDAARRYPTAQALAADLLRYSRAEPISVRPAGALERGYKWVRRNKVVAGAMVTVSLALLAGTAVSLGFGLEARRKQKDADEATLRADRERDAAIAAQNELKQSQERTNRAFAKVLLGPIFSSNRILVSTLTPPQVDALWQITELRREEASWLFLEEATRTPAASTQLASQAEYALHAAIGLDPARRDATDELLRARLQAPNRQQGMAIPLSRIISRSGFASSETAALAIRALIEDVGTLTSVQLLEDLSAAVARLNPTDAAKVRKTLADALASGGSKERSFATRHALAMGLFGVAGRLDPTASAEVYATLARSHAEALTKETDDLARTYLAQRLAAVVGRLDPTTAAELCPALAPVLVHALIKETLSLVRSELNAALVAVMGRLDPTVAARVCADLAPVLADALTKETDPFTQSVMAQSLAVMAGRLDPTEAAKVCAAPARALARALTKEKDSLLLPALAAGLFTVAGRLDPTEVGEVCAILADALLKETDPFALQTLAQCLAAIAGWLDPTEAAKVCAAPARALADALAKEPPFQWRRVLAASLFAVAERLDPTEAARRYAALARILADALTKELDQGLHRELTADLLTVVWRLTPTEAAKVCVAPARALVDALAQEKRGFLMRELVVSLSAVAGFLEPAETTRVCSEATRILSSALAKEVDENSRHELTAGLAVVTRLLPPTEAVRIISSALAREGPATTRRELAASLAVVAGRLPPAEAARVCAGPAHILADALTKETNQRARYDLAAGLADLMGRLDVTVAAQLGTVSASVLIEALATDLFFQAGLGRGAESLWAVTTGLPSNAGVQFQRVTVLAAGAFATPYNLIPSLPLLHQHCYPQLRLLPPQELVELLKHPFCVGAARRVVLGALELTYHRKFADQWEFVEYAQKHQPQLDLLSPPKRPQQP